MASFLYLGATLVEKAGEGQGKPKLSPKS
jgi:hypothetical protein